VTKTGKLAGLQYEFAAHLRDPGRSPPPAGLEDRRVKIYRDLFINNVSSLLASTFPVLKRVLREPRWTGLVRDFYRDHRCSTPLFLEISQEFLAYLAEERDSNAGDPPFVYELAHYEWVELALSVEESEIADVPCNADGNLLEGVPVLSPLAWPLAYHYPVHRISPEYQPETAPAEPSFYVVYRDRADEVGFMEINAVTMRLLERLQECPDLTGSQQLNAIADELPQIERAQLIAGGEQALQQFRLKDVLLGTRLIGG
jgi:hypothetical protein